MIMSKKPRKLVDLEVEAVAGVDFPANRRTFLVIKRANDKSTFTERLAALFKRENKQEPVSFDAALASTTLDDEWRRFNDALRTSIRSIIESDAENKVELAQETVQKYAENLLGLVPRVAKGANRDVGDIERMQNDLVALVEAVEKEDAPESIMTLVGKVEETAKALREGAAKGEEDMPNLQELLKSAPKELQDAVSAALAQKDAEIAALQKDREGMTDEINKADLPEPVRKRLEDLEKKAAEAERIAKAEREARLIAEIRKRAEGYSEVASVDDLTDLIHKAHGVSEEYAQKLETVLKAAQERIKKGSLFDEFGSAGATVSDDPQARFVEEVEKYVSDHKVDYSVAAREVAKRNPDLVAAYHKSVPIGEPK